MSSSFSGLLSPFIFLSCVYLVLCSGFRSFLVLQFTLYVLCLFVSFFFLSQRIFPFLISSGDTSVVWIMNTRDVSLGDHLISKNELIDQTK